MVLHLLSLLAGFAGMELVAWAVHKYVMHGFLWSLHRSHHQKGKGFFELNDFYFLFFASLGITFIVTGVNAGFNWKFFMGLGISLYGFTYLVVHDIIIHQRFKWFKGLNNPYINALRRAHKAHHGTTEKNGGVSFGMLWVDSKYFLTKKDKLL